MAKSKDIFHSIRLEGSLFFNSTLHAPWDIELPPSTKPHFHIVFDGSTLIETTHDKNPVQLSKGHVLFIHDVFAHRLFSTEQSHRYNQALNPSQSHCQLLCGTLSFEDLSRHPLIQTLPNRYIIDIRHDQTFWSLVNLLINELDEESLAHQSTIDRVTELLIFRLLQKHSQKDYEQMLQTSEDPSITRSLRLMHNDPAKNWTLETLSSEIGISRSVFCKRFQEMMGCSPMNYLVNWRLKLARKMLLEPGSNIKQIAHKCGYQSDTAFIRVFKQKIGCSPGDFRKKTKSTIF